MRARATVETATGCQLRFNTKVGRSRTELDIAVTCRFRAYPKRKSKVADPSARRLSHANEAYAHHEALANDITRFSHCHSEIQGVSHDARDTNGSVEVQTIRRVRPLSLTAIPTDVPIEAKMNSISPICRIGPIGSRTEIVVSRKSAYASGLCAASAPGDFLMR